MPIKLKADASATGRNLDHYWSFCVGAGRANEGLRAAWQNHLMQSVRDCGFKYLRFHGLFHDDMFVYHEKNGLPVYNWQYVDELFDRLLEIGIKPFVEFGFSPVDLATQTATCFWWKGNGAPPNDYKKWADLITTFLQHCILRYGTNEVRSWFFEVWNEPNLHFFFKGSRTQYFELYKITALAVKKVDSALRVGGPATSNFVADARFDGEHEDSHKAIDLSTVDNINSLSWKGIWIEEFLAYCAQEKLPLDFLSTHPYPTDWALDAQKKEINWGLSRHALSVRDDMVWLRDALAKSAYPNIELHLTEWNSTPSSLDHTHDYPQAGTYILKTILESRGLCESLSYWVFTDIFEEQGPVDSVFHGGFGLIGRTGIVKPAFHAYRFLNTLGNEELAQTKGAIVSRDATTNAISAIIYHYPDEVPEAVPLSSKKNDIAEKTLKRGTSTKCLIEISNIKPGTSFIVETVDDNHGFARRAWEAMNHPEPPTREQNAQLCAAAQDTRTTSICAGQNGSLMYECEVKPWAMVLIRQA